MTLSWPTFPRASSRPASWLQWPWNWAAPWGKVRSSAWWAQVGPAWGCPGGDPSGPVRSSGVLCALTPIYMSFGHLFFSFFLLPSLSLQLLGLSVFLPLSDPVPFGGKGSSGLVMNRLVLIWSKTLSGENTTFKVFATKWHLRECLRTEDAYMVPPSALCQHPAN